jgi:hypothetical protein
MQGKEVSLLKERDIKGEGKVHTELDIKVIVLKLKERIRALTIFVKR